jgi:hypothetical protein
MCHPPAGTWGLLIAFAAFPVLWTLIRFTIAREPGSRKLDPQGTWNAFEPFLAKYLRIGEFIVGLAAGSIVLLLGSSVLRGNGGNLPSYFASPLLLLGCCVGYGIAFMVWLTYHYEDYQHNSTIHTRPAYVFSLTLGFSAFACFFIGYAWLIFRFTR